MGVIIALANQKGGAGKTTASINISAGLARKKKKVLLVDLDSQAHCSVGLGYESTKITKTNTILFEALIKNEGVLPDDLSVNDFIIHTDEGFDFLPSDIGLASVEMNLTAAFAKEVYLRTLLKPLRDKYDYIILDCPPALGNMSINALVATDYVIIPTEAATFALDGVAQLTKTISRVKTAFNQKLRYLGVFVTRYRPNTNYTDAIMESIHSAFGGDIPLFKAMVAETIRATESNGYGQSFFAYCPNEKVTASYESLVEEIINGTKG